MNPNGVSSLLRIWITTLSSFDFECVLIISSGIFSHWGIDVWLLVTVVLEKAGGGRISRWRGGLFGCSVWWLKDWRKGIMSMILCVKVQGELESVWTVGWGNGNQGLRYGGWVWHNWRVDLYPCCRRKMCIWICLITMSRSTPCSICPKKKENVLCESRCFKIGSQTFIKKIGSQISLVLPTISVTWACRFLGSNLESIKC